jgi:hypothetical protein
MALKKSIVINNQILTPIRDLEILELPPLVKDGNLGKYVFLYDYEVTIYNMKAKMLLDGMPMGRKGVTLDKNSTYTLKYSKGDVVDVIAFGMSNNGGGVPVENKTLLVIKVPNYVKPITGFMEAFPATITIDNSTSKFNNTSLNWLQKVPDTTPLTTKLGVNFGANRYPTYKPVLDNPVTPNPNPTPTGTTTTPVVTNGVQDTTETKSFFDDKNNLLMIVGVILIGYLLLNDKTE